MKLDLNRQFKDKNKCEMKGLTMADYLADFLSANFSREKALKSYNLVLKLADKKEFEIDQDDLIFIHDRITRIPQPGEPQGPEMHDLIKGQFLEIILPLLKQE